MGTYFMAPAVNYLTKTLSGSLTDSATTITLNNTTNMLAPGYIVINRTNSSGTATPDNREVVYYTGISGSDLTGCTRGADGSTNRAHADGSLVETMLTAGAWNSLTTIVSTALDSNSYLKAIASPVSIARMQIVQEAVTSIASIARAEIGTLVTNTFNPASLAVTSIASIAQLQVSTIAGIDSWITSNDTWVFASASTFTISGVDRTAIYTKGTRLKFTNSGTKYAVVVGSAFSTNTTVTIAVNTDYVIANAAITSPFYSYASNPAGYPTYFNNTGVTVRGSGGSLGSYAETAKSYKFKITGNECYMVFKTSVTNNGSWTGDLRLPIPVTAADSNEILFGNAINQGVSWGTTGAIINYGPAYPSGTNILFKKTLDTNDVQITDMTAQYVVAVNGAFTY